MEQIVIVDHGYVGMPATVIGGSIFSDLKRAERFRAAHEAACTSDKRERYKMYRLVEITETTSEESEDKPVKKRRSLSVRRPH